MKNQVLGKTEFLASGEKSNIDGGSSGNKGNPVVIVTTPSQGTTVPNNTTTLPTTTQSSTTTTQTTTATTTPSTPTRTETTTVSNTDIQWGDANEDATVDVSDAVLIARFVAEDPTASISQQGKLNANVCGGKSVNSDCTIKILQFIAKIITEAELAP